MKKKKATKTVKKKISSKWHLTSFRVVILSSMAVFAVLMGATMLFQSNDKVTTCANSISCIKDLSGKFDPKATEGTFMGKVVPVRNTISVTLNQKQFVLGDSTAEKKIYVDLTRQMLYANEGDNTVYAFPVSTGKWGRTPTGTFKIWIKLRYTRMSGGNPAIGTYYNLPNVPYTMFYYNDDVPKSSGYSIHGAYWHNNFGRPMSHGCINMKTEEAEQIYSWANPPTDGSTTYATEENPGTEVVVYGTAPKE
ncbi:MAG: L,D-transpeptidase [Candidatus Levybacteria bacterium]|nr:L,D-transpeptidase [Candidatus Levybacteria bacterium]